MDSEQLTAIADDLDDALTADASVGDLAAIAAGIPNEVYSSVTGRSAAALSPTADDIRGQQPRQGGGGWLLGYASTAGGGLAARQSLLLTIPDVRNCRTELKVEKKKARSLGPAVIR